MPIDATEGRSDIENLYQICTEPEATQILFGYKTYGEFAKAHPSLYDQRAHLQEIGAHIVWDKDDADRIFSFSRGWKHGPRSQINWNAVQNLKSLYYLDLSGNPFVDEAQFVGTVDLSKLPQNLRSLHLRHNGFTTINRAKKYPPEFKRLDLRSNPVEKLMRQDDYPNDIVIN